MLFAIGTRLVQRVSIPGLASPSAFYAKAMEHLEVIVGLHDLKNVQVSCCFSLIYVHLKLMPSPKALMLVSFARRPCLLSLTVPLADDHVQLPIL